MSKNQVIVVIAILIVLGVVAFLLLRKKDGVSYLDRLSTGTIQKQDSLLDTTITSALDPEVVGGISAGVTTALVG
jgi:hypothetical protein